MEWTLATPMMDREFAISLYLQSLRDLKIDRSNTHLLFVDLSNNPNIKLMLEKFITNNPGWKSTSIESPKFKSYISYKNEVSSDFLERRVAIGDTMNFINSKRKGNLIIWEEDIYVPEDAFIECEKLLEIPNVSAVSACQYSRRLGWPDKLMAWDWEKKYTFGEGDSSSEVAWSLEPIRQEYSRGFCTVGATATGFILIKSEFLDGYVFDGYTDGQDVMLGKHINGYDLKEPIDRYILLNWSVKTVHIGDDENGDLRLFKSPMCKTEVYGIA